MSIKMIGLMISGLVLAFIGFGAIGFFATIFIGGLLCLSMAIVFTIKKDWFHACGKFTDPATYKLYEDKGEEFLSKNRQWSIASLYIAAAFMFFIGIGSNLTVKTAGGALLKEHAVFFVGAVVMVIAFGAGLFLVHRVILKRSRTAAEYWRWSIIIGLIGGIFLAAAYFIAALMYIAYSHA